MWSSRVVARSIAKMRLQGGRVRRHEAAQEKANEPDLHRDCWPCGADRPERIADRLATRARRDPMRRSRSAARNAALLRGGLELGRSYNRSSNAKVSAAGIRLNSRKIYRAFKGIICGDISEFESYMGSHTVRLCGSCVTCEEMRDSLIVPSRRRRMTANVRAERSLLQKYRSELVRQSRLLDQGDPA